MKLKSLVVILVGNRFNLVLSSVSYVKITEHRDM